MLLAHVRVGLVCYCYAHLLSSHTFTLGATFLFNPRGMQTWEYAPQYALRTYAYLVPMAALSKMYELILSVLPGSFLSILGRSLSLPYVSAKPLQFCMLRSTLAAMTALSELNLSSALSRTISPTVAAFFLIASLSSAGMFHAAPAYLPSAHVMSCWMCSAAAQLRGNDAVAIALGLVAVQAFGWPFSAVLFVTTGLWAVWKAAGMQGNKANESSPANIGAVVKLLLRTALHAAIIQIVVMATDYVYYGKIVSPIFNIFVYNTKGQGDELYGIEPLSYYVKNLFLNLNFVSILGLFALPVVMLQQLLQRDNAFASKMLVILPMYVWLVIVAPRPHKEERFLFPIYPMLCAGAGLVVEEVVSVAVSVIGRLMKSSPPRADAKATHGLAMTALIPIVLVSVSRSAALIANYSAPLKAYAHLHDSVIATEHDESVAVCVGGEWYRYPSSFYLPPNAHLAFLKSSFGGQLPQPFTEYGSKEKSLTVQKGVFNDLNEEEVDRYVDIKACSYVIELVGDDASAGAQVPEGLQYITEDGAEKWQQVAHYNYLNIDRTSSLHRIFYIPILRDERVAYNKYVIYQRVG